MRKWNLSQAIAFEARSGIFKLFRSPEIDSASLSSLAGRYDNPTPIRFLTPINCSTIPAQNTDARLTLMTDG
jgi:hypothetical protein